MSSFGVLGTSFFFLFLSESFSDSDKYDKFPHGTLYPRSIIDKMYVENRYKIIQKHVEKQK